MTKRKRKVTRAKRNPKGIAKSLKYRRGSMRQRYVEAAQMERLAKRINDKKLLAATRELKSRLIVTRTRRNPSPIQFSPRARVPAPVKCPFCGILNPTERHIASHGGKTKNVQITFGKRNPRGFDALQHARDTVDRDFKKRGINKRDISRADYDGIVKSLMRRQKYTLTEIAKRNPYGGYIIIGKARGTTWYLSAMGGFSKHKRFADLFHSSATAQRKARSIVNRLPKQIEYIAVRKSA